MYISIFDIFKIGIGPSSSHTFGPMKIAFDFINNLNNNNQLDNTTNIKVELYGSLALTKDGHGTGIAIKLGLEGYKPETLNTNLLKKIINTINEEKQINLFQKHKIKFTEDNFVLYKNKTLPNHPNGIIMKAYNKNKIIHSEEYYSIGGGFIETKDTIKNKSQNKNKTTKVKYEFSNFKELQALCFKNDREIWEIILENEKCLLSEKEIYHKLKFIFKIMMDGIRNSVLSNETTIEGGLGLKRRAPNIYKKLSKDNNLENKVFECISLWGLASAEENASYGRIVTAPTNGACGIIPATLKYYKEFIQHSSFLGVIKFLLTAGAIGYLCKLNASISGAECGCQAEIGSATSMAAAGLVAAIGGNVLQCENAAIIGLSHNLGLTCDPIRGLVQIPCIERNAINAVKAVDSAKLALMEEEHPYLTLDDVILTMKETGDDLNPKYKETALGGLAKFASTCNRGCSNCSYNKIESKNKNIV